MKNIVLIQSHCDTNEKVDYLKNNILKLKEFDLDILLFSHIPLSQEIIKLVDYFIYDKTNPILWDERRHYFWWIADGYKMETTIPDYGWTVFNQMIKSYNLIQNEKYEYVFIFNYDVIIDNEIEEYFKTPRNSIFKHSKSQNGVAPPVEFEVGIIFFVLQFDLLQDLITQLDKKNYSDNWNLIAEEYLISKLKNIGITEVSNVVVKDFFHQTNDIFNLVDNKYLSVFLDNQKLLKFRIEKKMDVDISVIVNDELIRLQTPVFYFDSIVEKLKTFGVIVEGEYFNLESLFFEKKINRMTFIN